MMKVLSASQVLGLKPLDLPEGRLLLVLQGDAGEETRLSVLRQRGKDWSELKQLQWSEGARALDAQLSEGQLSIALEVNRFSQIEVSRCRVGELLDPKQAPLTLQQVGSAALSGEQTRRVDLPAGRQWHAREALPRQWLFSPRFVPGARPGTLLVNTADGQAMLVSATGVGENAGRFAHPHAFAPQAIVQGPSSWMLAFLRMQEGADFPFWCLSRYHGGRGPPSGALRVRETGRPEQDLSQLLGLGPVFAFQLLQAHGQSWLFALSAAAVGTRVSALQRGAEGWVVRGAFDFDPEAELMAVAPEGSAWSVFLTARTPRGSTLHHRSWSLP